LSGRILLRLTAVIEAPAAADFLIAPSLAFAILFGTPPDLPNGLVAARIVGAPLLSLSVACWYAGNDREGSTAAGVVTAMLLYDVVATIIILYARVALGLAGIGLWPAVLAHLALGGWCVAELQQREAYETDVKRTTP